MRNLLVVAIPSRCTFRFCEPFSKTNKKPLETRPFASWKKAFCLRHSLLPLSRSHACTAGLFSPTFACRTIQLFSLALVQLCSLLFLILALLLSACCIASLKYLALSLSVDLMLCTTLVVPLALGFLFCVCLVLPPCPLL